MKRILEIGHGGICIGKRYPDFAKKLPHNTEYLGIDYQRNTRDEMRKAGLKDEFILGSITQMQATFNRRMESLKREVGEKPDPRIKFLESDIRKIEHVDEFDEVHLHFVLSDPTVVDPLGHMENLPMEMALKAKQLLKNGGKLVLTGDDQQTLLTPIPKSYIVEDIIQRAGFVGIKREETDSVLSDMIGELLNIRRSLCKCFLIEATKEKE